MATPDIFPSAEGLKNNGMYRDKDINGYYRKPEARDGLDLVFFAQPLNNQLKDLEAEMIKIMDDGNLSDVQKQFSLQQLMNSWSAISQGMTNMLKAVADVNKAIVRNIE